MMPRSIRFLLPLLALLFLAVACSDSTDPTDTGPADGTSAGSIDADAGTFVLKSVDVPMPGGPPLRIDLVGSDLVLDDDGEHVGLTVALRNQGERPLPAPTVVWLSRFEPSPVYVDNADTALPTMKADDFAPVTPIFGFIYDEEFGDDRMLEPGETSAGRMWLFRTMEQASFSFATRLQAGLHPDTPVIAGLCFYDVNRNGLPDRGEHPLVPGHVDILAPDGSHFMMRVGEDGHYAHPIHQAGLYEVTYVPDFETFAPLEFTTPNPRHVLITVDADDRPRSFHDAHFGAATVENPMPPVIRFTEAPLDSLHIAPWNLLETVVEGNRILVAAVGYSGCGPDHPFSLWTNGAFMESEPVQVNMVLVHELDEECDAAWTGRYPFDLGPLIARYREAYGPGVLMMNLMDFQGERHPILLEIPPIRPEG